MMVCVITKNLGFFNQIRQMVPKDIPLTMISPDENGLARCEIGITGDEMYDNSKIEHLFIIASNPPALLSRGRHFYKIGEFDANTFVDDIMTVITNKQSIQKLKRDLEHEKECNSELKTKVDFLNKNLEDAGKLQSGVMTKLAIPDFETEILYRPVEIVSGDVFLAEEIGDYVYIAVGDVTDHGYFPALYGSALYALAKGYLYMASRFELDVRLWAKFLMETSGIFQGGGYKDIENECAVVCLCEIDKKHRKARFISLGAGNLPPILIRKDTGQASFAWDMNRLDSDHERLPPIGTFLTKTLSLDNKVEEVKFKKGDALLFYTDGVTEVFKSQHNKDMLEEYSTSRLLESVSNEVKKEGWSPASVVSAVKKDINGYSVSKSLTNISRDLGGVSDDMVLACLRYKE